MRETAVKIAIASSGLGHVARGIETWALGLAQALAEKDETGNPSGHEVSPSVDGHYMHRRRLRGLRPEGQDESVSCGPWTVKEEKRDHGPQTADEKRREYPASRRRYAGTNRSNGVSACRGDGEGGRGRGNSTTQQLNNLATEQPDNCLREIDVTLFKGSGKAQTEYEQLVPCVRRGTRLNRVLVGIFSKLGGWRYGLGSDYQVEQTTFAMKLIPILRREGYDIVHLQDPWLAWLLEKARRKGRHSAEVILAHGTEESSEFRKQFRFLQELTPWHLEELQRQLGTKPDQHPGWTALPNFIDTAVFRPCADQAERRDCRRMSGLPEDAVVIGTVAAVKRSHKRIDHLVREFASAVKRMGSGAGGNMMLLVAGAKTDESDELVAMGDRLAPGRTRFMCDVARDRMPSVYRAMDVFVLPSLFEMMPIAMIEAMASGLPVVTHRHPVFEWIAGNGGVRIDMEKEGVLAGEMIRYAERAACVEQGRRARIRAEEMFSEDVVVPRIVKMYEAVGVRG